MTHAQRNRVLVLSRVTGFALTVLAWNFWVRDFPRQVFQWVGADELPMTLPAVPWVIPVYIVTFGAIFCTVSIYAERVAFLRALQKEREKC